LIDLKYHIASLVAVFLALAVGILIGTSLIRSQSVESQIDHLRDRFDRIQAEDRQLRADNSELQQQIRTLENALQLVVPAAVRARLTGKRIAVIVSEPRPDTSLLRDLKHLLNGAGASVASITTLRGNLIPENAASRQAILAHAGIEGQELERARRQLAGRIVQGVVQGKEPEFLRLAAQYSPGLVLDGDYTLPVDGVLLLAATSTEETEALTHGNGVLARVASVLAEQEVPVVVCERQAVTASLVPRFARYNLTTVDSVDTPLGKIALVYALAGKQGHFGTKPDLAQLLPELDLEPLSPEPTPPAR
jgi:hypothetical protein